MNMLSCLVPLVSLSICDQDNSELIYNINHRGSESNCAEVEGCGVCQLSCNEKFYERNTWATAFSKQPFPFTRPFSCVWCLAILVPLAKELVYLARPRDCIQDVSKEACYLYHSALNALATEAIYNKANASGKYVLSFTSYPAALRTSYYQASVYANVILNFASNDLFWI